MGRLSSALRRFFRVAPRGVQVLSTLHGFAEQDPSPKDEYDTSSLDDDTSSLDTDTSSLDEIEGVQFSRTNNSSEVRHADCGLKPDSTPKSLARLPTEIILEIAKYLPPSSCICLSYSCRDIRNNMAVSIAYVLGDKVLESLSSISSPSVELRNYRSLERMALRSLLDRDGKIPSQKVFCNGCEYAHDSSQFSLASLAQPRTERRCLGRAGRLWICPHRTIDFLQATTHGQTRTFHICGGGFMTQDVNILQTDYPGWRFECCSTSWPIMKVSGGGGPSIEQVKEALSRLSAPMCPHMRLDDARVANFYVPVCRMRRWSPLVKSAPECRCCTSSSRLPHEFSNIVCNLCRTRVMFVTERKLGGTEVLRLRVTRHLEDGWNCTDRRWISQVAEPADFEAYEPEWRASVAECRRRLISDLEVFTDN